MPDTSIAPRREAPVLAPSLPPLRSARSLGQLRERIRFLHDSRRTEEANVYRYRAFMRFHRLQHPKELDVKNAVESFLSWRADDRGVAAATHRQALSALLFLYGKVQGRQLSWMRDLDDPARCAARSTPRRPALHSGPWRGAGRRRPAARPLIHS